MRIMRLPAGFIIPAQPVMASKPPSGANWVHEIKHDGYRMIVRRDGPMVRIYSRNAHDWTARLRAIAGAAERMHKAILYAFDLIEHDGEDLRDRPFLDRKAALARLLRGTEAVSRSTNTLPRTVPPYSSTPVSTPSQRNQSCPQIQPCATSGQAEM